MSWPPPTPCPFSGLFSKVGGLWQSRLWYWQSPSDIVVSSECHHRPEMAGWAKLGLARPGGEHHSDWSQRICARPFSRGAPLMLCPNCQHPFNDQHLTCAECGQATARSTAENLQKLEFLT